MPKCARHELTDVIIGRHLSFFVTFKPEFDLRFNFQNPNKSEI